MKTRRRAGIAAVVLALVAVFAANLAAQKQGGNEGPGGALWTGTIDVSEKLARPGVIKGSGTFKDISGEVTLLPDGGQFVHVRYSNRLYDVVEGKARLSIHQEGECAFRVAPNSADNPVTLFGETYTISYLAPKCPYPWLRVTGYNYEKMDQPANSFLLVGIGGKLKPGETTISGSNTQTQFDNTKIQTWNLTRNEKLEVVVEIPGYDKWMPKGTKDEKKAGNTLTVNARLKTKDGSPLVEKARRFTFELSHVSHEPGVCMNFPATPQTDPDPDLQFDQGAQKDLVVVDDQDQPARTGLKARSKKDGEYTTAAAVVGAYDWGAYGEVRVTAEMPDTRKIVGFLKTDPGRANIRLPKRKDGSYIADAWKERWRKEVPDILNWADDDDGESDPRGAKIPGPGPGMCAHCTGKRQCLGGHQGDGLTLYEEYRGFSVNGRHEWGHPGKKDVFIHRRKGVSDQAREGIRLFASITGLNVHDGLKDDEIGPDKTVDYDPEKEAPKGTPADETNDLQVCVNANVRKTTSKDGVPPLTRGDKFGILMAATSREGPARGYGFPGWPKKVALASGFVPGDWNELRTGTGELIRRDRYPRYLAHELLHCCNVSHHGPRYENGKLVRGTPDPGLVFWALDGQKVVQTEADEKGNPKVDGQGNLVRGAPIPLRDVQWEDGPDDQGNPKVDGQPVNPTNLAEWLSMKVFEHNRGAGARVYVAALGGEHSGYQDCVMRYEGASVSLKGQVYRLNRKQGKAFDLSGLSLCDRQDDGEVSLPGLGLTLPSLGRYGNAPNGFCRSQICVNDWLHKP
jgi:hypothetical protein